MTKTTRRSAARMLLPAAVTAVSAACTADAAAMGEWWLVALCCGASLPVSVIWVLHQARSLRADPGGAMQGALLRAVKQMRKDEVWLNRDEHRVFIRSRTLGVTKLFVADEDQMRELDIRGSGAFTGTTYVADRMVGGVLRQVNGVRVELGDDGEVTDTTVRPSRRVKARIWARTLRGAYLSSRMTADAEEIRQVIASLRDAERMGSPES